MTPPLIKHKPCTTPAMENKPKHANTDSKYTKQRPVPILYHIVRLYCATWVIVITVIF